ncbi:MAG: carboxypeptidase-like regulatory domain-containing protein, partial [Chitinophagaceae bacterium]|nr:carboxypeptidase-like regulatory domain-containing protein [Chitinophagaceae bacterium]
MVFNSFALPLFGQGIRLKALVKDIHSDEPIPFATVEFLRARVGKLSDSAGHIQFNLTRWPADTLVVTYVGFEEYRVKLDTSQKQIDLVIGLERSRIKTEVVVRGKINRGLLLWRRIVKNKPINDRSRFENFSYELYNKLEIDLNKVNKEKMQKGIIPPKPFKFLLENIDTVTEENPILPMYLTETLSDYYFRGNP